MLREHVVTARRLAARCVRVRTRIESLMPMTTAAMQTLNDDDDIDVLAFLKTYEQFEDTLGRTLKTISLVMAFGKPERLTPRDVANRAIALGVVSDGRAWADAVRVRNELAHEYPLNPAKQTEQVNRAWDQCATLLRTLAEIETFIDEEGLLNGDL